MAAPRAIHVNVPQVSDAFRTRIEERTLRPMDNITSLCKRALADATALCKDAGIPASRQLVISGRAATRENVRVELERAARALPDDALFVLTFAGHGSQIDDVSIDEADHLDEAWCLYDDYLIDDEIGVLLERFARRSHVVLVSEACFSGGITEFRRGLRGFLASPRPLWVPRAGVGRPRRRKPKTRLALFATGHGSRIATDAATLARRVRDLAFLRGEPNPACPRYRAIASALTDSELPVDRRAVCWFSPKSVDRLAPFDAL